MLNLHGRKIEVQRNFPMLPISKQKSWDSDVALLTPKPVSFPVPAETKSVSEIEHGGTCPN